MTDLTDKVAVITGASRGIGAATAVHLAEQGAKVVLVARSADKLESLVERINEAGGEAVAAPGDVTQFADLQQVCRSARQRFGSLDILINNAGVIEPIARITESDPELWGRAVDINLKGVYHGLRAALPLMEQQGSGTIVNISSGAATSSLEGWSHYCATKAGAKMLTQCAHKEYGDKGITVVGLSPGTVATDMMASIRDSQINPVSQLDWSAHIPPEWPARAIAFLCGEGGLEYAGQDFSIKTSEGRARVGLE